MGQPLVLLGGGGHASVMLDLLELRAKRVVGYTDIDKKEVLMGIPYLGDDSVLDEYSPIAVMLVNGIGFTGNDRTREMVFEKFKQQGFSFPYWVHPAAYVSKYTKLEAGVQIMAGAVVQPGCTIRENSIVNTRASLDHDTYVGRHVHIAPGATICGGVVIDDGVFIGAGATVIQGIRLGRNSVIAAGAVVTRDVQENAVVMGVPAREARG